MRRSGVGCFVGLVLVALLLQGCGAPDSKTASPSSTEHFDAAIRAALLHHGLSGAVSTHELLSIGEQACHASGTARVRIAARVLERVDPVVYFLIFHLAHDDLCPRR